MAGVLTRLREMKGFTASEQVIAEYLLAHLRDFSAMSGRQLAKSTFTNSATVTRFSRKLGFVGFTEFKVQLLVEMGEETENAVIASIKKEDSVQTVLDKVQGIELDAVRDTFHQLRPTDFMRALPLLLAANTIDIYATDTNVDLANMAANIFAATNKCVQVPTYMTIQYQLAANARKDHLGFIISRTGGNRFMLDIAKVLKKRGVKILLITSEKDSALTKIADVTFISTSGRKMEELGFRTFLCGAKCIIDTLFALLMMHGDYQKVAEKSQWMEESFYY